MKSVLLFSLLSALFFTSVALGIGDPTLTETALWPNVTVHYTTAAGPNQTTRAMAEMVATEMDFAVKVLDRRYRPAISAVNDGKLHVDIKDLSGNDGVTDGYGIVGEPRRKASYINLTNHFAARAAQSGLTTQEFIRVDCMHECMHAVQNAYNGAVSPWFKEAQAAWAEGAFTGLSAQLTGYFAAPDSVPLKPELPLWAATASKGHEYSLSAFVHFLVRKKGFGVVRKWLEATEGTDDAMAALQTALGGNDKNFSGLYRQFLYQLWKRDIRFTSLYGGRTQLVLPPVTELPSFDQLGQDLTGAVLPTGAGFVRGTPDDRIPNTYAIAKVEQGASGTPELLVIKRPQRTSPIKTIKPPDHTVIKGFNAAEEVLCILTDTTAPGESATQTPFNVQLLSPYLHFKTITQDSPITAGARSNITITYDLLGLPPSITIIRLDFRLTEKGPGVADRASQEINARTGEDQTIKPFFQSAADKTGTYRFQWTGRTPVRSFSTKKLPQSVSSIRNEIVVNAAMAPREPVAEASAELP